MLNAKCFLFWVIIFCRVYVLTRISQIDINAIWVLGLCFSFGFHSQLLSQFCCSFFHGSNDLKKGNLF